MGLVDLVFGAYFGGAAGFTLAALAMEEHPKSPMQWCRFTAGALTWFVTGPVLIWDEQQRRRRER